MASDDCDFRSQNSSQRQTFDIRKVNQCFKICLWISLTNERVLAFKLRVPIDNNSNVPPLAFNCSNASSFLNKNAESTYILRNPLTFAISAYKFCGFHLHFAES